MTARPSLSRAARSRGSAISESRSSSASGSPAARVSMGGSLDGESSGKGPCTRAKRVTTERPKKQLMRSISSGARCCSSSAAVDAARNLKTPSRPSADGQATAAQSGPTIAAHCDLRRRRTPPPRLATIGAASFDTATPTARNPRWRSLSRTGAGRLSESSDTPRSDFIVSIPLIRADPSSRTEMPDSTALLAWYDRHRRNLPWRAPPGIHPDPYRIWLSEIMLQQTTVATVGPYFDRFVARWPDISALAAASLDEILRLWQGLGYYARARNLHACARAVVEQHGGALPQDPAALRALPGIGEYTAAAIAAIAFDQPAAALDGNGERVIARLYAVRTPLPAAKPQLKALIASLAPERRAGDFVQALMDLGATICTPRRPRCVLCPWRACCAAAAAGVAEALPVQRAKPERPSRYGVAFWLTRPDGAVLLRRRPEKGLLGGMTEIPSTPWRAEPWIIEEAVRNAPAAAEWTVLPGLVRHGFTHFVLELTIMTGRGVTDGIWSRIDRLGEHALPTLMKKVARHAVTAVGPRATPAPDRQTAVIFPGQRSRGGPARRTAGGEG